VSDFVSLTVFVWPGDGILFTSSTDVSCSFDPAAELTGDVQRFGMFERNELIVSDPNGDRTDVGEPFSCSYADRMGDEDRPSLPMVRPPLLGGFPILRGYGCAGFLLGRGGGISIGFMLPVPLDADSLTTCSSRYRS